MKSIGELITQAKAATASSSSGAARGPAEPRMHRVSVCYMVFAELHIVAESGSDARGKAMENLKHAKRKFRAEPYVFRVEAMSRKDPATGEPIWVEVSGA